MRKVLLVLCLLTIGGLVATPIILQPAPDKNEAKARTERLETAKPEPIPSDEPPGPPGGGTDGWGAPFQVTNNSTAEYVTYAYQNPVCVDAAGNFYVTWYDTRTSYNSIAMRRWVRATATWDPETLLSGNVTNYVYRSGIAVDSAGNIHLVWYSSTSGYYGIWYKRRNAATGTWIADSLLYNPGGSYLNYYPSIACRPGRNNIHVAWQQRNAASPTYYNAYHMEFTPGTGWTTPVAVDTGYGYAYDVGVDVDANNDAYVTWRQQLANTGNYRIWLRKKTAGTWGSIEEVSGSLGLVATQYMPDIAVTPAGNVHCAWYGSDGAAYYKVFYRARISGAWNAIESLSTTFQHNWGYQYYPGVSVRGDTVDFVWSGADSLYPTYRQLQYRRKAGGTWSSVERVTNRASTYIYYPSVRMDRGDVHVAWYDASAGTNEVWYVRRTPDLALDFGTTSIDNLWPFQPRNVTTPVAATVRNFGTQSQPPGVPVALEITGPAGYLYRDTTLTTDSLPFGATRSVAFSPDWTVPSVRGTYSVKVWTLLAGDGDATNDTARTSVYVYPGFYETFTGTTFPPANWQMFNFDGGDAWSRYTSNPYTAPACARILYDTPNNDWLITPRCLASSGDDSLIFYMRTYLSGYYETLYVKVSNTSQSDTTTFTQLGMITLLPTSPTSYQRYGFDLSAYIDSSLYIAFVYKNYDAWGFQIDDIMGPAFYTPLYDVAADIGYAQTYPLAAGEQDSIRVQLRNAGRAATGSFKAYLAVGGTTTDSVDVASIPVGDTAFVDLHYAPSTVGRTYFKVSGALAGDENPVNDSFRFDDWVFPSGTYKAMGFEYPHIDTWPIPGWAVLNRDGGVETWNWYTGAGLEHSGVDFTGCGYESGILRNDDWLISDVIVPAGLNVDSLGFFWRAYSSSFPESLEVFAMSGQTGPADTIARLFTGSTISTNYLEQKVSLDAFDDDSIYIGFHYPSLDQYYVFADDIWWQAIPPPPAPALVSPVNGSLINDATPAMVWNEAAGANRYRLHIDTSSAFPAPVVNVTTDLETYTPPTNLADDGYWWRVQASRDNGAHWGDWSAVWSFTLDATAPVAPTLVEPADGSATTNRSPQFIWSPVTFDGRPGPGQDGDVATDRAATDPETDALINYRLQVYTDTTGAPLINVLTPATTFTPTAPLALGTHFWRVQASDTAGNVGVWSGYFDFTIVTGETGWVARAPVPAGPKGKKVKDGAALASMPVGSSELVWLLKGNNTVEFYAYDRAANVWATKESLPAVGSLGKKKTVKKGATLAAKLDAAQPLAFAAKGNNTLEWWRYDPGLSGGQVYPWQQMRDVPPGAKNLKEGVGSVWIKTGDTNYVYLLRGSSSNDFHRYNVEANAWTNMAPAPVGASGKPFKNGSALTIDRVARKIYAIKGTYGEFFAYDIATNTWNTLSVLPITGSAGKKKVKDGCGLACDRGIVYALHGGNTNEFWYYRSDSSRWEEWHQVPPGGGKKVKGGGALAWADGLTDQEDLLYATKGNNTDEFYSHPPLGVFVAQAAPKSAVLTGDTRPISFGLNVTPNPFTGTARISYTLPQAGRIGIRVYDVLGKLVGTIRSGHSPAGCFTANLDARELARGIYLLKFETETATTTSKLIIE